MLESRLEKIFTRFRLKIRVIILRKPLLEMQMDFFCH